ncbi:hypothetical protein G9U51_10920 [Calidifontibacter sp. DB0510]|uniref:DUF3159 domain-containing protein n=1 Tax=Metallococcus carri TaxID=1656884 RepID=A0A967B1G4_9MICO|nr:VC0807 family protein [Metallococcus carri]NHN56287.1 hypothetical protein [Metallococcus carri]NOP38661.1 hypothetical protein [Calidifontibacter sp. DB2511S]
MVRRLLAWQRAQMAEGGAFAPRIAMRGLATMLAWDLAIPVLTYVVARLVGLSTTWALLASTIAAGVRMVYLIRRQGEVDGFSAFMVFVFAGGLALSWWTGDARFLLLKGCFATVVVGVIFAASSLVRRPLSFEVAKRLAAGDGHSRGELQRGWAESAAFRRGMYLMTSVWGLGLVVEALLRIVLIYRLDVDRAVIATTVVQIAAIALMGGWNVWFVEASRRYARGAAPA